MLSSAPLPRRPPSWRLPDLRALWSRRAPGSGLPPLVAAAVVLLAAAGVACAWLAAPAEAAAPASLAGFLHVALPLVRALTLVLIAVFAWAAWLERDSATALVLAAVLPAVALLAGREALAAWQGWNPMAPAAAPALGSVATRLLMAAGLQLAWAGPALEAWSGPARRRRLATVGLLASGMLLLGLDAATEPELAVPSLWLEVGDGVSLVLIGAALPILFHLHRRSPSQLSHAALLGLAPLAGAQLAALASGQAFDAAALLTQGELMLANATFLCGVLLELVDVQGERARMQGELREAERDLESTALEVGRAQAALAAREADYRRLIDGASDLIQSVGPDGSLRFVNPAWLATLGYSREEATGLKVWDVIDPAHHAHCRAVLARLLSESRPERVEIAFRAKSGARIEVEGNLGVRIEEGQAIASIGIFRDVSERRRLEQMRQDFLSTVSHELRTPLTSMLGSLGLLNGSRLAAEPEQARELLEIAERNGERLLRLVNDLLDLQRLEAGQLRFQWSAVAAGPLMEEAVRGIQGFAEVYQVRVRTEAGDAGARLVTDRDRLVQVLYNLLSNAIKFSPAGEEVVLALSAREASVELSVRDHGPGLSAEAREHLFEPFAQGGAPGAGHAGSGLGLSIAKKLVQGLGGTIALASAPGGGTEVRVDLPRRAAANGRGEAA